MKKDKEVKTLQNGVVAILYWQRNLLVTSEVPWEAVLRDLVFFFSSRAVPRYSAPAVTEQSGLLWKLSCNNQGGIWPLPQQVLLQLLWDRYGRIDAILRRSRKDAQQMLLMCFCVDNVLSRWTPRYLTDVLKGTLFPPMFAHSLSTDSRRDAESTGITSVLSVFNFSLLLCMQSRTPSIHVWIQDWTERNWSGELELDVL